jgi:hypothetical protein
MELVKVHRNEALMLVELAKESTTDIGKKSLKT